MKFTVVLEAAEEGGYTVQCVELPAAISQGETKKKALKNIKEAIQLVLEVRKEQGAILGELMTVEIAHAQAAGAFRGRIDQGPHQAGFCHSPTKGSHVFLQGGSDTTVVPFHDEVKKSTLKRILKQTNVTLDQLLEEL